MNNKPALITETKLNHEGSTDAKVTLRLKVTYFFKISTANKLSLPYAVAINGRVPEQYKSSAKKINCAGGKIEINVTPGDRVQLFLNSDAHPSYRTNPVYSVTTTNRDVTVHITEKSGKCNETDELVEDISSSKDGNTQHYKSVLTGDIWLKISHKYTIDEVQNLLGASFSPFIVETVKEIYNLKKPALIITLPSGDTTNNKRISVSFTDSENAHDNIKHGYELLSEGLVRVHPAGYAAILEAAIKTGISKIRMTSAWRPMKGSIAHRAGLGLDIDFIGSTHLNRQELRGKQIDTKNVSDEEKKLFSDFESAKKRQVNTHRELKKIRDSLRQPGMQEPVLETKRRLSEATSEANEADTLRKSAESAWIAERDKNEPNEVRRFREALIVSSSISQLFDPWVMDSNTRDKELPIPNIQSDDNETLHAHHLHITVHEPKIL